MTQNRFEDLGLRDEVLRAIRSNGWTEPTPIQVAAIPLGMEGNDILAQAQTGTGKTGTYGSIIISRTEAGAKQPTSLVLVPTRELAWQVAEEMEKLARYTGHVAIPIYGGVSIEKQVMVLRKGVDVLIATPGRLDDLMQRGEVSLSRIAIAVLDEADRMLDMGFIPIVTKILSEVPKKRQTLMFSATVPADVRKIASKTMINHKEVMLSPDEPTIDSTAQYYLPTTRLSKTDELTCIIEDGFPKMMVFCRSTHRVDNVYRKLSNQAYSVGRLHGDIAQKKREKTIREFIGGDIEVLIATDVASRGLDIDGVDLVVNYDIPADPDSYIHRVGRTGRAGAAGRAITFVTNEEADILAKIEARIDRRLVKMAPKSYNYKAGEEGSYKARAKAAKKDEAAKRQAAEKAISARVKEGDGQKKRAEKRRAQLGRTLTGKLDRGHLRGRAAERPAKTEAERPKKEPNKDGAFRPKYQGVPKHPRPVHDYVQIERAPPTERDYSFDRLEFSIGKDDGLTSDKLLTFVVDTAGIPRKEVGKVRIFSSTSRMEVVRCRSQEVVDEMFGQTYRGKRVMVYNLSDKA